MFQKRLSLFLALWIAALGTVAIAQQNPKTIPGAPAPVKQATDNSAGKAAGKAANKGGGLQVGASVPPGKLHRVSRPGLYGMSEPPAGSAYGIVDNRLIRFDPESQRVLSIIRQVDEILD